MFFLYAMRRVDCGNCGVTVEVVLSVEKAVEWGPSHRDLSGITSFGVDEVLWRVGYKFLTVVYRIDAGYC